MARFTFLLFTLSSLALSGQNLYERAEESYVLGRYDEALDFVDRKIEKSAEASDFLLRALIHEANVTRSNAYDDFLMAIDLDRDYHEAYFLFAKFMTDSHEYEKAAVTLNELLRRIESGETQGHAAAKRRFGR